MNYPHGDLDGSGMTNIPSPKKCQEECKKRDECVVWTYRQSDQRCWRKNNNHKPLTSDTQFMSGPRDCSGKEACTNDSSQNF